MTQLRGIRVRPACRKLPTRSTFSREPSGSRRHGAMNWPAKPQDPPRVQPGGPCVARYDVLDVVASPLHVGQEAGKRGPADDVRSAFRMLAVPDGRDARNVGGDLNAAAVMNAKAGFSPDSLGEAYLRLVGHYLTPFAWRAYREKPSYPPARAPHPRLARTS